MKERCPSCGGLHFGSNGCVYDKEAERLLNEAADFMASNLPKPNRRVWDHLLIYCPREALERRLERLNERPAEDVSA